ncbi:hypothetical protein LTR09_012737 [Extremus antarcticus]|uniref:Uncharacterized protein n=1 Tax=Extremus antarcticus TaxID=702011 RepID=A0AAJ0D4Q7_9PEZI|nr:hypothetical protein LTR09_012737 [Extremus antarcticus]
MAAGVRKTDYAASTWYAPGRNGTKMYFGALEKVQRLGARLTLRANKSVALPVLQSLETPGEDICVAAIPPPAAMYDVVSSAGIGVHEPTTGDICRVSNTTGAREESANHRSAQG